MFIESEQNTTKYYCNIKYLTRRINNIFIYMFQNLHLPIILAAFQEQCFQERIHRSYKRTFMHRLFLVKLTMATLKKFCKRRYSKSPILIIASFHNLQAMTYNVLHHYANMLSQLNVVYKLKFIALN